MVLRFNCPCGAPYTLADHLAGRTFTCTACGVVLKIGAPADAPPPPAAAAPAPAALPSMEWGAKDSGPALKPLDDGERPGKASARVNPPSGAAKKSGLGKSGVGKVGADAPLALADEDPPEPEGDDEGVYNSLEDDAPVRPKSGGGKSDLGRSGSARLGKSAANLKTSGDKLRTSGTLRTSGVTKGAGGGAGKGTSGRQGPARGRSADDHPAVPVAVRSCPVCDTAVPAVAVSCPSCGVRLKEKSAVERMLSDGAWQGPVKSLLLLALAGGIGYGAYSFMQRDKKPERPVLGARPQPGSESGGSSGSGGSGATGSGGSGSGTNGSGTNGSGAGGSGTNGSGSGGSAASGSGDNGSGSAGSGGNGSGASGSGASGNDPGTNGSGGNGSGANGSTASTERRPPRAGSGDAGPGAPPLEVVIPSGALREDFERLRDAPDDGPGLRDAIAALAAKPLPALNEALGKALASVDESYLLRLHRVRLAAGDEAARRKVIDASIQGEGSSRRLLFTAIAALELDPATFASRLQAMPYEGNQLLARTWVDAALERTPPSGAGLQALSDAFARLDEEGQRLVAPVMVLGGDGARPVLARAIEALEGGGELLKPLAAAGLERVSAGTGPVGGDAAAWRQWVETYVPARELVAAACVDPEKDFAAYLAGKRALMPRGAEVVPLLPVLVQDRAVATLWGAQTIGDLLTLHGATNVEVVKKVLASLNMDRARQGGAWIVRGALLSCDEAVADEAAAAIIRGAVDLEPAAQLIPDLVRPAGSKTQEALSTWIESLGSSAKGVHARVIAAAFRGGWLEGWVLNDDAQARGQREVALREEVAARLGSARLEKVLLGIIRDGKGGPPGFPNQINALNGLAEFGTENAAEELAKIAAETLNEDYLKVVGRKLGDERHAKRFKRLVDTTTDVGVAPHMFDCYARLVGRDAGPSLARRAAKADDPCAQFAVKTLLQLGGREAREHARRPFQSLGTTATEKLPTAAEIDGLARSGGPEDGALLAKVFPHFPNYRAQERALVIISCGRLGWTDGASTLQGWVFSSNNDRAVAAAALALIQDKTSAGRMRETALYGNSAANGDPESAVVAAALATLDPAEGGKVAREYVPAVLGKRREEAAVSIAFALALAEDDAGLSQLARSPIVRIRAMTARGIALAARVRGGSMVALPVIEDLRFDPDLSVRAEIAVARGLLNQEGAQEDVLASLSLTHELLGAVYGAPVLDGPRAVLAHMTGCADTYDLRGALWSAWDACTPGDAPPYRPELTRGRQRELVRQARATRQR